MLRLLQFSNYFFLVYYAASNLVYLVLLIVAFVASAKHRLRLASMRLEQLKSSPFTPPITVLVPARNEQKSIVENVEAMLELDYPALEVIVINDGSSDGTLAELMAAYQLRPVNQLYVSEIRSAQVRRIYASQKEPRLVVLDKQSGGSKADAINAGLNAATGAYVCVVDADSILEKDALLRIMSSVFSDTASVVGVGGIVRVLNGSKVEHGAVSQVCLPRRPLEVLQVVEYLRAFLVGREAWASFDMLPIISGAFGVFRTDLVRRVGGFRANSIGEDLDLVVRMHRYLLDHRELYRIAFVPDPTCWTEVPADLGSLGRQRARWQKGLFDVLWSNRDMVFRPRYKRLGCFMLPYLWTFELLAPVVEALGYLSIIASALLGVLSTVLMLQFLVFGYAFATMISIGSVLLEELTYRRYNRSRDVARLVAYCLLEHLPYRQLNMVWRLYGMWQYLRGDVAWGSMRRAGLGKLQHASSQ
ncbi:MAG: glycosyltransferase family 2 protein [Terriglobales bacterium]